MAKKIQTVTTDSLKPIQIINNKGQLEGLPKNPRFIRTKDFDDLKTSISECPEMTYIREVVVFPFNENYIIIAGNMRFKAMEDLKFKTIPCKILHKSTPVETLREIAIKDNVHSGKDDWDIIANEWDKEEVEAWGVDLPLADYEEKKDGEVEFSEFINESNNYVVLFFDNDIDWLQAQTHFELKTVTSKRANGKPWSKGIGRVLKGSEYLNKIK